ncbi:hypothetical protein L0F63_003290 [Massospora cicadina]|nr:hypothetical protein L0F63_003290 [Massospora cicadina]
MRLCGLLAVMIILAVTRYCRALMDRFSIRFTLAISLVDFLKALAIYLTSKASLNPVLCVASSFAVNWLLLVYLFLNVAIAANLQMVFINGKVNTPSRERTFWALSFAAATAIMLVPLGSPFYVN